MFTHLCYRCTYIVHIYIYICIFILLCYDIMYYTILYYTILYYDIMYDRPPEPEGRPNPLRPRARHYSRRRLGPGPKIQEATQT